MNNRQPRMAPNGGQGNPRPTHPLTRLKAAQASHKAHLAAAKATDSTQREAIHRLMSARRLKMNDLKNENEELIYQVRELREENKLMKRNQIKQEKALGKFEDAESELPRLVLQHTKEATAFKEQMRKGRDQLEKNERRIITLEAELAEKKEQLKKLNSLSGDKSLLERDTYRKKLEEMEKRLRESEEKGSTLQRYSDNLQKNFNRQISNDKSKHQETTKALTQLKRAHEELKLQCKEQEKILDITNIYSNRKQLQRLGAGTSMTSLASRATSRDGSASVAPKRRQKSLEPRKGTKEKVPETIEDPTEEELEARKTAAEEEERRRQTEVAEKKRRQEEDADLKRMEEEDKMLLLKEKEIKEKRKEEYAKRMREKEETERREQEKKQKEEADLKRAQEEAKSKKIKDEEAQQSESALREMEDKRKQLLKKMKDIDGGNTYYDQVLQEKPEVPHSIMSMELEKKKNEEREAAGGISLASPSNGAGLSFLDADDSPREHVFSNSGIFSPATEPKPELDKPKENSVSNGSPNSVSRKKNLLNDLFGASDSDNGYVPTASKAATNNIKAASGYNSLFDSDEFLLKNGGTHARESDYPRNTPPKNQFPWETSVTPPSVTKDNSAAFPAGVNQPAQKQKSMFPWDDVSDTTSYNNDGGFLTSNIKSDDVDGIFGGRGKDFGEAGNGGGFGVSKGSRHQPSVPKFSNQGNPSLFTDQDDELEEFTL